MNSIELRQKRAGVWEKAKKFLADHTDKDGMMSAEDTASYEKMEKDIQDLGKQVDRMERAEALDREMAAPTASAIVNKPNASPAGEEKTGKASDEYRKEFWNMLRDRRFVKDALQVGTDSEGGYLVPDEYERTLVEALEEENIFRTLATIITTTSGERKIPVASTKGTASWIEEEGAYPESDDAFTQVTIGSHKLATMIKISDELMQDSAFDLESYIANEFARRIGAKEEEAFFTGDGTGKPMGIFPSVAAAADNVTTTGASVSFDDMMELYHALKRPYRRAAKFIMNDATVKSLRKLKDNNGQYIWQASVVAGTPDTVLNCPVVTSAYAPALEAGKAGILFGDYKYYWIADRQGRSFKRLNELFAATGQVGFLGSERVDGKLILPEAVKALSLKSA